MTQLDWCAMSTEFNKTIEEQAFVAWDATGAVLKKAFAG